LPLTIFEPSPPKINGHKKTRLNGPKQTEINKHNIKNGCLMAALLNNTRSKKRKTLVRVI